MEKEDYKRTSMQQDAENIIWWKVCTSNGNVNGSEIDSCFFF
jgi:hypothetical protein